MVNLLHVCSSLKRNFNLIQAKMITDLSKSRPTARNTQTEVLLAHIKREMSCREDGAGRRTSSNAVILRQLISLRHIHRTIPHVPQTTLQVQ